MPHSPLLLSFIPVPQDTDTKRKKIHGVKATPFNTYLDHQVDCKLLETGIVSYSFSVPFPVPGKNLTTITMFCMYNVHPWFWPKLSGKKSFVLIFNVIIYVFIVRYCFLYYKGILTFILDILWYKKFYVTNNYKIQEQIQGISGTTHI